MTTNPETVIVTRASDVLIAAYWMLEYELASAYDAAHRYSAGQQIDETTSVYLMVLKQHTDTLQALIETTFGEKVILAARDRYKIVKTVTFTLDGLD